MRRSSLILLGICAVLFSALPLPTTANSEFLTASGKNLRYKDQNIVLKGINFDNVPALGANIGSGNMSDINTTESDYQKLSGLGGNMVRFGMSFNWYKNNRTQFFQILDQHVGWARENNLWILPQLFTTPANCYEGYSNHCSLWGSQSEKNELKNFWVDFATHFKNEKAIAGYDLLNEPTPPGPQWCSNWFDLAQVIRDAIYTVDQNHLVFISACSDSIFTRVFNGNNIVYEAHDYTPISLTHADSGSSRTYPGYAPDWNGSSIYWDKAAFSGSGNSAANLKERLPINWTNSRNLPLFIGEWGTRATYSGYVQYVKDHSELFNEWNINHTHYGWRHNSTWKWGIYPVTGNLVTYDQPKLDAMKISFQGAIKPDFNVSSPQLLCGDGVIQTPNSSGINEICDDGNTSNNDQCSSNCLEQCTAPQYWNGATCVNPSQPASITSSVAFGRLVNEKIEAEYFDEGGQNVSYFDKTTYNKGNSILRDSYVDIKETASGENMINWMEKGEWLQYSVVVPSNGTYSLTIRAAATDQTRYLKFEFDGEEIANIQVPMVSSWGQFGTNTISGINLNKGSGVLKITLQNTDWAEFDWFQFSKVN